MRGGGFAKQEFWQKTEWDRGRKKNPRHARKTWDIHFRSCAQLPEAREKGLRQKGQPKARKKTGRLVGTQGEKHCYYSEKLRLEGNQTRRTKLSRKKGGAKKKLTHSREKKRRGA